MPALQFANYAKTALATAINAVQTSINVASSTGFPVLTAGQSFYATLVDYLSYTTGTQPPGQREIVKVTAIAAAVWTITRAQDGTAAQTWNAGDIIELRANAQTFRDAMSQAGLPLNVKVDYGAVGDGVVDDTAAINSAIAAANLSGQSIFFPAGRYKLTATPTAITAGIAVFGTGVSSILSTDTAGVACLKVNAANDLFGVEIHSLAFDSPTGAATTAGLELAAANAKFLAFCKFHDLHFTGVKRGIHCTMAVTVVSGPYNVIPFSNNNFVNLTFTKNTAGNYPQYGVLFDSGCGPHNVFTDLNIQSTVAGIQAGDGVAGLGDLLINASHFNFATDSIKLTGPVTLTEYRQNIAVTNCQFDGGVTNACNFTRISQYQLVNNVMGGGVHHVFSGQCDNASVEENNIESRFAVQKTVVGTGAQTVDLGKFTITAASTYCSTFVEVCMTATVAGVAQAVTTRRWHINWNAGVPTITSIGNDETPAAAIVLAAVNAANEVKIQATIAPTSSPNVIYGNVRAVSPYAKWTYL
jgi:hypothetical protein